MRTTIASSHALTSISTQRLGSCVLHVPVHQRRSDGQQRMPLVAQAVKAVDVLDHADMATGFRVNPERRAARDFNPRDILSDCGDWRACASLLQESPQRFERNKTLAYFMLVKLADLLGPSEAGVAALQRFTAPLANSSTGQHGEGSAGGGGIGSLDPYADLLARDAQAKGKRMVGPERAAAMQLVAQVLKMAVGNLDQMRSEHVCGITFTLARLGFPDQQAMKAVLLYIKSQPKRFKVAELYACLAACVAMGCRVPPSCVQAMLDQGFRGGKFVTPADLNNVAYALHAQPRGAITHQHVYGIVKAARSRLFDMSGEGLAYLGATIARQGYRPAIGFRAGFMEALGPHLDHIQDPSVLTTLLYGLASLKVRLHQDLVDAIERVMCTEGQGGVAGLSPEELGLFGSVLATDKTAVSAKLRTMYIGAVRDRLSDVDEQAAASLLTGLAYMSPAQPLAPAPAPAAPVSAVKGPAGLSPSVSARLAKMSAKKAAGAGASAKAEVVPSPANVHDGIVSELLELVEGRLPHMGGHALQQVASAVQSLNHTAEPEFVCAFRQAVSHAVPRCGAYPSLVALARAAGASCPQLRLREVLGEGEEDQKEVTASAFAAAVAAQAFRLSQGPAIATASSEEEEGAGDGMSAANGEVVEGEDELEPYCFLPKHEELIQLKEALAALPGGNVEALELPQAAPAVPSSVGYPAPRQAGRARSDRDSNSWEANSYSKHSNDRQWYDNTNQQEYGVNGGWGVDRSRTAGKGRNAQWQQGFEESTPDAYGGQFGSDGGWGVDNRRTAGRGTNTQWQQGFVDDGFGVGDGYGADPAGGWGWEEDGFGQQKGWRQGGGARRGGGLGQERQGAEAPLDDVWGQNGQDDWHEAGTKQGQWGADGFGLEEDNSWEEDNFGRSAGGRGANGGGARYVPRDAPRRRVGAARPSVQDDGWYTEGSGDGPAYGISRNSIRASTGSEESGDAGGGTDQMVSEPAPPSGDEWGAPAPPTPGGFSAMSTFAEDGMADFGAWQPEAGGGNGGPEDSMDTPPPPKKVAGKVKRGPAKAAPDGQGFVNSVDEADFGFEAGWVPDSEGLGDGPQPKGPSMGVFSESGSDSSPKAPTSVEAAMAAATAAATAAEQQGDEPGAEGVVASTCKPRARKSTKSDGPAGEAL